MNGMTRKQFFKLLVALMYLASSGDVSGFQRLLSRRMKMKFREPGMTSAFEELNAVTLRAITPQIADHIFQQDPLFLRLWRSHPFCDGGRMISEPLIYSDYVKV